MVANPAKTKVEYRRPSHLYNLEALDAAGGAVVAGLLDVPVEQGERCADHGGRL